MSGEDREHFKMVVLGVYKVNTDDVVFLVEEKSEMVLPIFIGQNEAMSIQLALENIKPQRPFTHDLIVSILDELQVELEHVTIDGLLKNVYTATLHLRDLTKNRLVKIDARPSDSIAIALRTGSQIYADRSLREQMIPRSSLKLPDQDKKADDDFPDSPYGA